MNRVLGCAVSAPSIRNRSYLLHPPASTPCDVQSVMRLAHVPTSLDGLTLRAASNPQLHGGLTARPHSCITAHSGE